MLAVILALVLVATACGGSESAPTSDGAGGGGDSGNVQNLTESETLQIGGDAPDDFPLPIPDGGTVTTFLESDDQMKLNMLFEGDRLDEFVAIYQQWVDANATEVIHESTSTASSQWIVKYDGGQALIGVTGAKDNDGNIENTIVQLSP